MSLTTKEVIARLDAIGDCLGEQPVDPEAPHLLAETWIRRATLLLGKLRGELGAQVEKGG